MGRSRGRQTRSGHALRDGAKGEGAESGQEGVRPDQGTHHLQSGFASIFYIYLIKIVIFL